ncbi:MAG: hypothetical protein EXQ52_10640 [Bryobacterales bacterium]|nr:hypothetical protein [Bryobacterales bacterium]
MSRDLERNVIALGMELRITPELKRVWAQTLAQLRGGESASGLREWLHELRIGVVCLDAVAQRGRKPLESKLPKFEADLREMGAASSQTDPTFRTTQLYRRLTAGEAR